MDSRSCRHCRRSPVTRPRGLCWRCYYTPGLRDLFPKCGKYARQGVGLIGGGMLPVKATASRPGSEDKLRELERRAAAGENLWHPKDAPIDCR